MKYFILISAILGVSLAGPTEHPTAHSEHSTDVHGLDKVHKQCQDDSATHVEEAIFEKMRKGEKATLPENFDKHMLCMAKGLNLVTEEGNPNVNGIQTHVEHIFSNREKIEIITKKCTITKDTPEHTAKHIQSCLHKHKIFGDHHDHDNTSESHSSESNESHVHHKHGHH